jgi:hypothetical protein
MPRETLRVPVHPDLGYAGLVLDLTCDAQARVKWRLIQGFTPSATGNFVAGPLSLASESPPVTRNPLPEAHLPVEQLIANIGVQSGDELFRSLIAARQKLWAHVVSQDILSASSVSTDKDKNDKKDKGSAPTPPAATDAQAGDRSQIVAALAARLPSLSPMQRVLIASMMPHAGQIAETAPLDAALLADTDPSVQIVALLTRVKKADDPALVAATKSTDPRLSELASLLSTRLATETMCYAKLAPGLAAIRGDIEVVPSEP